MPNSTYKVIELVGSSEESWEQAARNAVETAAHTLKDLRIAEVTKFDARIEDNKVVAYRVRLNLSFKYLADDDDEDEEKKERKEKAPKRKKR
jgi:hypothetical protein